MSGVKGKSGRKKTPLAILKRRGSRLDRRTPEIEVLNSKLIRPEKMCPDQKLFYDTYEPILLQRGVLDESNSLAFERMSINYARLKALDNALGDPDNIKKLFAVELTKQGKNLRTSHIYRVAKECELLLKSQMADFALIPSSRGNVTKIEIKRDGIKKLT